MGLGKKIVAVVGATVLLAGLVGTASAGRLSTSSQRLKATFVTLSFSGGFGIVECEVAVEGSFHERTITKTVGTLSGFITAANISRCRRGGATVLREALPWHIQYAGFTGRLPAISTIVANIIGIAFRIREPTFGVTCLASSNATITFNREASGATTSATVGAESSCEGVTGALAGTTSTLDNGSGARITVTLI